MDAYETVIRPVYTPFLIPVKHDSTPLFIYRPLLVGDMLYNVSAVRIDEPYAVIFAKQKDCEQIAYIGNALSQNCLFPEGANVVIACAQNRDEICVHMWNRLGGENARSIEAAAAAFSVGCALDACSYEAKIKMSGGSFFARQERCRGPVSVICADM